MRQYLICKHSDMFRVFFCRLYNDMTFSWYKKFVINLEHRLMSSSTPLTLTVG